MGRVGFVTVCKVFVGAGVQQRCQRCWSWLECVGGVWIGVEVDSFSLPLTMGGRMAEEWLKYKVGQASSIHKQLTSQVGIPSI
jgi:hypothetical protein